MAKTATYSLIASTTIGTAVNTYTFSSIPGTFTDLLLIGSVVHSASGTNAKIRYNSDTAANYSGTFVYGNGTTAASGRATSDTAIAIDYSTSTTNFSTFRVNIQDYANTTTYKTNVGRNDEAGTQANANVGLWRSTSAINSITIFLTSSANMGINSTLKLYGIQAGSN